MQDVIFDQMSNFNIKTMNQPTKVHCMKTVMQSPEWQNAVAEVVTGAETSSF